METLKKELNNGKIRNIYLFYGEEEYLKEKFLEKIEDIVLPDGLKDINKIVMNEEKNISKIVDVLETLPCFCDKKLVVVKDSLLFKAGKKDNKKEELERLIDKVPDYTCLVFLEKEIDKRLKVVKEVAKKGLVVEFKMQMPGVLLKWVAKEFKASGKIISKDASEKLIDYSDRAMFSIINEINKLSVYACDREEISVSDIENVCTKSINVRIFDLMDNISIGNQDLAFKNLKEMIILKEPIQKIMFMIIKHVRQLLEMKLLLNEGYLLKDCVSKMSISPYTGNKLFVQVKNFQVNKLKSVLEEMVSLDYKIKNGEIRDILAVELLIIALKCH